MKESSTCKKRVRHSLCVPVACEDAAVAAAATPSRCSLGDFLEEVAGT